jgi:hypothetical protein
LDVCSSSFWCWSTWILRHIFDVAVDVPWSVSKQDFLYINSRLGVLGLFNLQHCHFGPTLAEEAAIIAAKNFRWLSWGQFGFLYCVVMDLMSFRGGNPWSWDWLKIVVSWFISSLWFWDQTSGPSLICSWLTILNNSIKKIRPGPRLGPGPDHIYSMYRHDLVWNPFIYTHFYVCTMSFNGQFSP